MTNGFIPSSLFRAYADLNGAAAAKWLMENGVKNVTHSDKGSHGEAVGEFDGKIVSLSTNGYLSVK